MRKGKCSTGQDVPKVIGYSIKQNDGELSECSSSIDIYKVSKFTTNSDNR